MSATLVSSNTTLKVNRAISGATTVTANSYAVCTYTCTTIGNSGTANSHVATTVIERYFGPAQSIPATFTALHTNISGSSYNATYTLVSGVEFINTP